MHCWESYILCDQIIAYAIIISKVIVYAVFAKMAFSHLFWQTDVDTMG